MNCHICGKAHSDLASLGDCCYDEQCRQFAANLKQKAHVMAECDLGRTVQVDHNVTTFVVTVRSLSNVGTDSIKNLIEKKFEVVDINIADYQTVVR